MCSWTYHRAHLHPIDCILHASRTEADMAGRIDNLMPFNSRLRPETVRQGGAKRKIQFSRMLPVELV
jgi:hypothetical protein